MEDYVDHYAVLGLPSGEEGSKLTDKEISKAFKVKALELHPDKRPDDPNAHVNFQKLKTSYEVLKDEKARKLFDDLLRVKREHYVRRSHQDAKRRRMVSDLEKRERDAFAPDPAAKAREEEERIARQLKEEIARIRAMHSGSKGTSEASSAPRRDNAGWAVNAESGSSMDKERMLKVSWEKAGEDYTAGRLKELFSRFGEVEDVVIKSLKKRGSALVVMATKDAAVAATGCVSGNLENPLLVVPVKQVAPTGFQATEQSVESERLNNLVGASYKAYEDSVLEKLEKAAARRQQKNGNQPLQKGV